MNKRQYRYILEEKTPVPCADLLKWAIWNGTANRIVEQSQQGNVRISTVFLGYDHSSLSAKPELFETMVFGGKYDEHYRRYATWEEAKAGHQAVCQLVFSDHENH